METLQLEWVDKYCPKTLKDYVLDPDIKTYFKNMVKNRSITSFSVVGCQGSGKSTICKVICNELDADVLFVKCSTEGVVDTIRTKIEPFCNAMSLEGKQKCIILDELDSSSSSGQNSFQLALRTLIESAQSDCRFFVTCNYVNKVIPAILSRCPVIPLSFSKKDLLVHIKKILDSEAVKYDKDSLKAFIEDSFKYYPDIRRIVKYLQICCSSGSLVVKQNAIINNAKDDFIKELIDKTVSESNLLNIRQFYLKNKDKLGDFLDAGTNVFNYVIDNNIVIDTDGILKLTDLLFYLNQCVDKESIFFGILTAISKYKKA